MDERPERDEVRALVMARDMTCRMAGRWSCYGGPTVHHLRKSSAGGPYDPHNLILLCQRCNDAVESERPDEAHSLGLVVRMGETIGEAWQRMYEAGLSSSPEPGSPPSL